MSNAPLRYPIPPGTTIVPRQHRYKPQPMIDMAAHDARVLAEREAAAKFASDESLQTAPPAVEPPTVVIPPPEPDPVQDEPIPADPALSAATLDLSEFPGAEPPSPAAAKAARRKAQS